MSHGVEARVNGNRLSGRGKLLTAKARRRDAWTVRYLLPVTGPLDLDRTLSCGQAFRWTRAEGAWRGIVGRADLEISLSEPALLSVLVRGEEPLSALLGRADDLLYRAKEQGRNRVVGSRA